MYIKTLTVSELNNYIKKVIDSDFILGNAYIKGEISNFKLHSSGHIYFSLKDDGGKINCIMFRSDAENLKFMPENGMKVNVKGRVSVYIKDGAYQLYCKQIELEGMGELYIAFEKLKEKLFKEGLFSDLHKKAIPKHPRRIGVITSRTGAAIRDIINVSTRRNKNVNLLICPVLVQGINAATELVAAVEKLNKIDDVDVIIIARGGGSIEELWAFNDEKLAYAVYSSNKPIISGVGHETDFTIVDFVSDKRAPTPSAAAEIAVQDLSQLNDKLGSMKKNFDNEIKYYFENKRNELNIKRKLIEKYSPEAFIANGYANIDKLYNLLLIKTQNKIEIEKQKLTKCQSVLKANNPHNILNKGYSIIENNLGKCIDSIDELKEDSEVRIIMKDGRVETSIGKITREL